MDENRLKEVLEQHKKWLMTRFTKEPAGGRANLCDANLRGADLCSANLCDADLCGANLRDANLCGADLRDADLRGANLCDANLRGADLCGADLCDADLCGANLRGANHSERTAFCALACPEEGAFVGFKKACGKIVKLRITDDAKRSSATTRKCRCSKAEVLGIFDKDGSESEVTEVGSDRDSNFRYRIGEIAEVADYDGDRWNECSTGIHFFITFAEAVNY